VDLIGAGRTVGVPSSLTFVDGSTWTPLPGEYDLACDACGATWVGEPDGVCPWCVDAAERQQLEQRRVLLFPDWLYDRDHPRYDDLDEVDRRVWDRTRGTPPLRPWDERLARAVQSEIITRVEADAALTRTERGR
jgi:hypothetical protein